MSDKQGWSSIREKDLEAMTDALASAERAFQTLLNAFYTEADGQHFVLYGADREMVLRQCKALRNWAQTGGRNPHLGGKP